MGDWTFWSRVRDLADMVQHIDTLTDSSVFSDLLDAMET